MFKTKTIYTTMLIILLFIFFPQYAVSQEIVFCDNAADILTDLSKTSVCQSSTKTRGLTRSFTGNGNSKSTGGQNSIIVLTETDNRIQQRTIVVKAENKPACVNLKIHFDYNSCMLRPDAYTLVRELGKALTHEKLADRQISILGHTDADGSDQYNLNLSLKRAKSVKNYLVGNFNISPSRLHIFGYGETEPLVPNMNAYNKRLNRRVEIRAE